MTSGNGNGSGNGTLRRVLFSVVGTIMAALSIAAILAVVSVRDRVGQLESSWAVGNGARGLVELQRAVDRAEGKIIALEEWRGQGQRFTRDDGERQRASLQQQIDKLKGEVEDLRLAEAARQRRR